MNSQIPFYNTKVDKAMSPEQFSEIVEAIHQGKYSWACVLILRFAGYNPLHYIPYRTYNRLIKENSPQLGKPGQQKTQSLDRNKHPSASNGTFSEKGLSKITDLAYLEAISEQNTKVQGGSKNQDYNLLKSELLHYIIQRFCIYQR
jgi:hypothetical protein